MKLPYRLSVGQSVGLSIAGALLLVSLLPTVARADCDDPIDGPWDTGVDASADCDGDGSTPAEGDCDDRDPEVGPTVTEVCGDGVDNDCDGFIDGACEGGVGGSIRGGASCVSSGSALGLVPFLGLLAPAFLRRRRG